MTTLLSENAVILFYRNGRIKAVIVNGLAVL